MDRLYLCKNRQHYLYAEPKQKGGILKCEYCKKMFVYDDSINSECILVHETSKTMHQLLPVVTNSKRKNK